MMLEAGKERGLIENMKRLSPGPLCFCKRENGIGVISSAVVREHHPETCGVGSENHDF